MGEGVCFEQLSKSLPNWGGIRVGYPYFQKIRLY